MSFGPPSRAPSIQLIHRNQREFIILLVIGVRPVDRIHNLVSGEVMLPRHAGLTFRQRVASLRAALLRTLIANC